jgi:hypothetical protein
VSPSLTPLASATISNDAEIIVALMEPNHLPAKVKISWPARPSLIDPEVFPDVANTIATLFARAHIVLASVKAGGEL